MIIPRIPSLPIILAFCFAVKCLAQLPSEDQYYQYDDEDYSSEGDRPPVKTSNFKANPGSTSKGPKGSATFISPPLRPFMGHGSDGGSVEVAGFREPGRVDQDSQLLHSEEEEEEASHKVPPRLAELEALLHSASYDSYHAAAWEQGRPVKINLQMQLASFSHFRPEGNSFTVEMFLRKSYADERLAHHGRRHLIVNEPHLIHKVWKPDLYFANGRETSMGSVTKPHQLLKVHPDGRVEHSMKLSAQMTCHASLHAYPVDAQVCEIQLMSYAHPVEELLLSWAPLRPLSHSPDIRLPEMTVLSVTPHLCDGTFDNETFSCLEARVSMERKILGHLLQTYLPSAVIVAISWVSFWIDPYAVPARVTLSFTTLLTLTTQAAGIRVSAPAATGAKALDYWMGTCTLFVLCALLEYTWVNSQLQKAHQSHLRQKQRKQRRRLELFKSLSDASSDAENGLSSGPGTFLKLRNPRTWDFASAKSAGFADLGICPGGLSFVLLCVLSQPSLAIFIASQSRRSTRMFFCKKTSFSIKSGLSEQRFEDTIEPACENICSEATLEEELENIL